MVNVASGAAWGISSRCGYILIEGVRHDGAAGIDLHKGKTNLFTNEGGGGCSMQVDIRSATSGRLKRNKVVTT